MNEARVICDSIAEHSPRLTTFWVRQIRFTHSELLRHRSLSFSASSSRAVPVAKSLAEVRDDNLRAAPVWWGKEQKGMESGSELSDDANNGLLLSPREAAKITWENAALHASDSARVLKEIGAHKSIVNRLLEPFLHINVVITGCELGWLNFFGLRLDKAAQPELRDLAEKMWAAWQESEPRRLAHRQWHLPFIEPFDEPRDVADYGSPVASNIPLLVPISAARCARTSYTSYETGRPSTVEEDLKLYNRLVSGPIIHASPCEHQATPDEITNFTVDMEEPSEEDRAKRIMKTTIKAYWCNPQLHGNLPGWIQYRKTLPNESIAPLPNGYVYNKPEWKQ